jgi:hypothetical protein
VKELRTSAQTFSHAGESQNRPQIQDKLTQEKYLKLTIATKREPMYCKIEILVLQTKNGEFEPN